ncbi:MAG: DUF4097 domain-containing protein [Lachnospiraceae bacterium]|nr:DUF4097 domain-containing protein [Lachnospiraceae bacterium]
MKKGFKTVLPVASCFMVIGLSMITVSALNGGFSEVHKLARSSYFTLSADFDNIFAPTVVMDFDKGDFNDDYDISTSTSNYDIDEDITGAVITVDAGNVTLREDDGNPGVKVSSPEKCQCYIEDGIMYLTVKTGPLNNTEVKIDLPEDTELDDLTLSTGASKLKMEDINCHTLNLEIGAGNADIDDLNCSDSAFIEVGAGNFKASGSYFHDADINTGIGEFSFSDGDITGNLNLDCGIGNVDLDLESEAEDHNISVDGGIGNIRIDGDKYHGLGNEINKQSNTDSTYTINCGTGNVDIDFD